MKQYVGMLLLPVLLLLVAPVHAEVPSALKAKGEIVIAVVPNYPPLEFKDPATSRLTGFDIDLGDAIAANLGVRAHWQETAFAEMINALSTGRVNLILSGMTDLPSRRDSVTFVDYASSGPQFYTMAAHSAEFGNLLDVCGKSVATSRRTSFPGQIADWSAAHCQSAGKPAVIVVGTEGSADARIQLRQGRADAAMQGSETISYMISLEPGTYLPIGSAIAAQHIGIGVTKTDTALQTAVQDALNTLIADGTYAKLLAKWELSAIAVSKATINGSP